MLITRKLRRRTAPLTPAEVTLTLYEDELLALAKFLDANLPKPGGYWYAHTSGPLRHVYDLVTKAADDLIHADRANRRSGRP